MDKFSLFLDFLKKEVPSVEIRYKDKSKLMKILNAIKNLVSPRWLEHTTTAIGNKIYFGSADKIRNNPKWALYVLAHEAVHVLDSKKYSPILFQVLYFFPQILVLGVFFFPLLGYYALFFLFFLLPIPAPFRFYFEARAMSISILVRENREEAMNRYLDSFYSWNYYRMFPFRNFVKRYLEKQMRKAENAQDKTLSKVLLWYEATLEEG